MSADPPPERGFKAYWFGYLYAAFWAFVTYSCATHVVFLLSTVKSVPTDVQERTRFFTTLFLWPISTVFFGWVVYRLLRGKAGMTLISLLVALHALSVLAKGIIIEELVWWVILSAIAIFGFKQRLKSN